MKEGWLKNDEGWMKNELWGMMISSYWGVLVTDRITDICECRVAFATENVFPPFTLKQINEIQLFLLKIFFVTAVKRADI